MTGARAKVLGSVRIGDDVAIQGNAFVIVDVSWISIAVEVLAKVRAGEDSKRIRAGNEKGRRSFAGSPPARSPPLINSDPKLRENRLFRRR